MASQVQQVLVELRDMILNGDLKPGERLAEIPLAERLNVSRTPIRHALSLLEAEGLLSPAGARGFEVRRFSVQEIVDAIDVRGALEGLAAKLVAQHGVTRQLRATLESCVAEGEAVVAMRKIDADGLARFAQMNDRLHNSIIKEAGNVALDRALAMNNKLPFAAASSVAWEAKADAEWRRMVLRAQIEHEQIAEALIAGDAARAEVVMREHSNVAKASIHALADAQSDITSGELAVHLAVS